MRVRARASTPKQRNGLKRRGYNLRRVSGATRRCSVMHPACDGKDSNTNDSFSLFLPSSAPLLLFSEPVFPLSRPALFSWWQVLPSSVPAASRSLVRQPVCDGTDSTTDSFSLPSSASSPLASESAFLSLR